MLGFCGGSVVRNSPANAGDRGLVSGLGKSHMPQDNYACVKQLLKPEHLEPVLHNKRSHRNEKPTHCKDIHCN